VLLFADDIQSRILLNTEATMLAMPMLFLVLQDKFMPPSSSQVSWGSNNQFRSALLRFYGNKVRSTP
jgi:hypothetical protein